MRMMMRTWAVRALAIFQGTRILARWVWTFLRDQENPLVSEDLHESFNSSIKSGAQTVVSGAIVVAAKIGSIKVLKNMPVGRTVSLAIDIAKVLIKLAKGELTTLEPLEAINSIASAIGGFPGHTIRVFAGAAKGAVQGAFLGGPFGAAIGAVIGGIAASKVGEAVWEDAKTIIKTGRKVVKDVVEGSYGYRQELRTGAKSVELGVVTDCINPWRQRPKARSTYRRAQYVSKKCRRRLDLDRLPRQRPLGQE